MSESQPLTDAEKKAKLERVIWQNATEKQMLTTVRTYRILAISADDQILLRPHLEHSAELQRRFAEDSILYRQEIVNQQQLPDTRLSQDLLNQLNRKQRNTDDK